MSSRQKRLLYVAAATLVAFARSVEAKGKGSGSSRKASKTTTTSNDEGDGGGCSDSGGKPIPCPLSKAEYIVIGIIAGIVVLVALVYTLCGFVRERMQRVASKKKDSKGVHHKVPVEEATLPLYHNQASAHDPGEKQPTGKAESEKPYYSTPYDPVYPTLQYDQFSDTASMNSSVYNAPAVTHAQPQDYSKQDHDNTDITSPPGIYTPPPARSHH